MENFRLGVGAWIRSENHGKSFFFPLHAENHGKIEQADFITWPLDLCLNESVGGGAKDTETPESAVLRELKEERNATCVRPDQITKIPEGVFVEQYRKGTWVNFIVALYILHLSDNQIRELQREQGLFGISDSELLHFLCKEDRQKNNRYFRPFTSAFGRLLLRHNFYSTFYEKSYVA